jgi:hypothetical protein
MKRCEITMSCTDARPDLYVRGVCLLLLWNLRERRCLGTFYTLESERLGVR